MTPTTLTLFKDGAGPLPVRFFPPLPRADLLEGLREAVGVAPAAPLRFRDSDGAVVIVAPSMPDATLHVKVESGFPEFLGPLLPGAGASDVVLAATPLPIKFELWKGTELSSDGMKYHNGEDGQSWWALTSKLPTAGQHFFTVRVFGKGGTPRRPCCVQLGFVDAARVSVDQGFLKSREYPWMVSLQGVGIGAPDQSSTGWAEDEIIRVKYDADKHSAALMLARKPEEGPIFLTNIAPHARFAIHGAKHSVFAELNPEEGDDDDEDDEDEEQDEMEEH